MKSGKHGAGTLEAEVTHISMHGFWLLLEEKESFLPFENFPWFKDAPVSAILNVKLLNPIISIGLILMWTWPSNRSSIPNAFRSFQILSSK